MSSGSVDIVRRGGGLPTFLIIGAMKAGTTSLYSYLRKHPQIFMPAKKELDFFVERKKWPLGPEWYRRQFQGAGSGAVAIGEASTSYSKYPLFSGVPRRIADLLPEVRLIYLVRHPIERARSHYLHLVRLRWETRPLAEALFSDAQYLDASRYAMQAEQYFDCFPRDRLLFIVSERLRTDRGATLRRIFRFIGVNIDWTDPVLAREYNRTADRRSYPAAARRIRRLPGVAAVLRLAPGPLKAVVQRAAGASAPQATPPEIPADLRRRLEDALRDDVGKLRTYVGDGFDGWGIG